ncbi:hypothetical protein HYH02_011602 [Chlamydomonas schloesseri]|uniref:U1-type domain-containing protein n=1 Tax=Chlamydomonas schloesseri TaxID=2026947 RepID=A0A835W533_9CHLO|nr:hypothetical protein HYH02_011602 [Chlamydomonas schloesseri]|eukprot:KAG2436091.1 hypothetical protein HYH02_011602 [Chlamydomonas schloesseri]
MTEYWKSNAMYWCDVCKCWLNDTKAARLNHERGAGHQAKLEKKLLDMHKKAERDAKAKEVNEIAMSKIEAAAKKQYEQDKKAAEAALAAEAGQWTWDKASGYYYNETHRWYYDPKTQWYYGGEPAPSWSQSPPLPASALFGTAPHIGGPVPLGHGPGTAPGADAAGAGAAPGAAAGGSGRAAAAPPGVFEKKVVTRTLAVPKHPVSDIGGYQAPTTGRVGGAMGAGIVLEEPSAGAKRKREEEAAVKAAGSKAAAGKAGKAAAISKEEAEALARREAARQRVAQRTAAGFGYV